MLRNELDGVPTDLFSQFFVTFDESVRGAGKEDHGIVEVGVVVLDWLL